jgi:hypothetical protein
MSLCLAYPSIGGERAFTSLPVIDDRLRIGVAKVRAGAGEFERRAPWPVDRIAVGAGIDQRVPRSAFALAPARFVRERVDIA